VSIISNLEINGHTYLIDIGMYEMEGIGSEIKLSNLRMENSHLE
jgi:hypothetical protein